VTGVLAALVGSSGPVITLDPSYNASHTTITPTPASASWTLESDGDIAKTGAGAGDIGDWIAPKGAAPGSYECRATLNSGDTPSGTLGSWLALTSNRTWSHTTSGPGVLTCELLIEIRLGTTVLDSTTVTITVEESL